MGLIKSSKWKFETKPNSRLKVIKGKQHPKLFVNHREDRLNFRHTRKADFVLKQCPKIQQLNLRNSLWVVVKKCYVASRKTSGEKYGHAFLCEGDINRSSEIVCSVYHEIWSD